MNRIRWGWVVIGTHFIAGCGGAPTEDSPGVGPDSADGDLAATQAAVVTGRDCNWSEMNTILAPPSSTTDTARVGCNFSYPRDPQSFMKSGQTYPGEIQKGLVFGGDGAAGITFSCKGHRINAKSGSHAIFFQAKDQAGFIAHHITVKDCEVNGNIRLLAGDQTICKDCADPAADAIAKRQATAPHHIALKNLKITVAAGDNGVHFASGVTFSSLSNSSLQGSLGKNTAIYLSPESANNAIVGNNIAVTTETREEIAIDGSANNYIADNDLSALEHGGIYIFRNCGEPPPGSDLGTVRIQKPWNNSIVNNRFYYNTFNLSSVSVAVASRTYWVDDPSYPNGGILANVKPYCNADAQYPFGSGNDNTDNAKNTSVIQNQIRKGTHGLTVDRMIRPPDPHDVGSWPYFGRDNSAVDNLKKEPTRAMGAVEEPPVKNSLYLVQGNRLWRTDAERGFSVALKASDWTGSTSMATLDGRLYVIQNNGLYQVDPATGDDRRLTADTWAGPTSMAALGSRLYIVQAGSLWYVDDFTTGQAHRLGTSGAWSGTTTMTALGSSLYIIQDSRLWKVNPDTGTFKQLGDPGWGGSTLITGHTTWTADLTVKRVLYAIQDGQLWRVDNLTTGRPVPVGAAGTWTGATSMTTLNGKLYVIQAGALWSVIPDTGAFEPIERPRLDYSGPTIMTALPGGSPLGGPPTGIGL